MEKFTEKYKKIKVIGSGQFGKAILVEVRKTGTPAVVKVSALPNNHYHDMEKLQNEIKIMETLDHPYIVKIIDHLKLQKSICIVMQYAEMGDLEARIKTQKKLGGLFSKDLYSKWIAQLLCGLHHVHQNNVIHRDIKSQNIFLKSEGDILIGDFGVSKKDNIAATFIGSPYYVSPEMVAGKKYSQMTDVWSLGVLFYEIVTLGYPFTSRSFNQFDIQEKILRGYYSDPPQSIDPVVRQMIKSMLVVNPRKRVLLETLLGYTIVKEILVYEGTLPDAIMMTSPSCFRNAVVTNTVNIKFGSMDSRNSPASTTSKGSLARSTSRNSSMTKKKMSTTPKAQTKFGLAAARRQASIEKNKQDLNLQINSKPYLKQNTEKSYKTMEPPKCKAYKAPPMPKKTVPSLSNFDPGTNQPAAKRGELSCRVSGSNTKLAEGTQESSSTSPLKSKNLDQGVHKDKQLSGLLTLCKQVDMKHGISNSIDSNFNNGNLFDEIREVDGEGDLTEKDLTIEISEVIENKKVISHADRSILGYMQDEKALEQYKSDIKKAIGENKYAQLFDSIQNQIIAATEDISASGVDQKHLRDLKNVVMIERVLTEGRKLNAMVDVLNDSLLDSSEVLQVHLKNT